MLFAKAMQALSLSESQRMSILSGLNQNLDPCSSASLKDLSEKLLSAPMNYNSMGDVSLQDYNVAYSHWDGVEEDQAYRMVKKTKNRPGLERAALQVASANANYPNSFKGNGKTEKGG